jgi:hypothetical protein
MAWRVFAASAIGTSHRKDGKPCQDAFAHRVEGEALVAAVCDGAGSCEFGHLGARAFSESVVQTMSAQVKTCLLCPEDEYDLFRSLAEDAVAEAREGVQDMAKRSEKEFSAFASTLVGVVAWPSRGHFFHIGDGYAVARPHVDNGHDMVSLPENGEYTNETYFVTGGKWHRHLRIVHLEVAIATVVLMSDGAAPFTMTKGQRELHRPFIDPIEHYLDQVSEAEGSQALASTLNDPRTHSITTDDKTLLIARWV